MLRVCEERLRGEAGCGAASSVPAVSLLFTENSCLPTAVRTVSDGSKFTCHAVTILFWEELRDGFLKTKAKK